MAMSRLCFRSLARTFKSSLNPFFAIPMGKNLCFFSSISQKLHNSFTSEYNNEKTQFRQHEIVESFLNSNNEWKFEDKEGEVNMTLFKTLEDGKRVSVEFQLISPLQGDDDNEIQSEMTDFSVTIEDTVGKGLVFYCSTINNDEKFRYIIGNIRYFSDTDARNSPSSFNGPDFQDLDDTIQENIDEWLSDIGINDKLCNFIDACSVDKEQREYINWLSNVSSFLK